MPHQRYQYPQARSILLRFAYGLHEQNLCILNHKTVLRPATAVAEKGFHGAVVQEAKTPFINRG